jgi:hypothetical protein
MTRAFCLLAIVTGLVAAPGCNCMGGSNCSSSPSTIFFDIGGMRPVTRARPGRSPIGDSTSNVSAVFSFLAHPGAELAAGGAPYTMAVIGDLGQKTLSPAQAHEMTKRVR